MRASELRTGYSFSFWDSLIVGTALSAGANTLYSEDMQDGLIVANQLTLINPFKRSNIQ
jgi:predicted nucleic acid-binding protein